MSDIKTWETATIGIDEIIPMPENERYIEQRNVEGLKRCIQRFGLVELPIWNKTTKHLIGGHQRFYTLKEMGVEEIDVIVTEMSEEDELAANLTMNNPHIQGEWTENTSDLLHAIEAEDKDLYQSLNMDILQKEVDKLIPKMPDIEIDNNFSLPKPDFDTQCPCCKHKWMIEAKDSSFEIVGSDNLEIEKIEEK